MLTILIGRAGSGKSERVLKTIARERTARPQVLLVPEHTSHAAELDLCRMLGPTASRDAEVLSFSSLARRILTEQGGLAEFTLDAGGRILTLRRCLQDLQSQLKVFGRPSRRSAFLQQLAALMEEFYAYEITPEQLWQQVEPLEGSTGDKLRDVALLYGAYDARLHTSDFDARSRMQKLREALPQSGYMAGKDVYADGFSYFNRQEEGILTTLLRQSHHVTVTLLGAREDETIFRNALRQRQRLERLAKETGSACEIIWCTAEEKTALQHLERHFFGDDALWPEPTDAVRLYEASTAYREVEHTAAEILALVRSGACRFRDIGVTARNMTDYGPVLENVFRRSAIPAYLSRRSDILEKSVLTLLLSAVDAVSGGLEYEDMFRYLKTGMAGISRDECDLLENYVIRWDIRGNMWLRDAPWTANPEGYGLEMTEHRTAQLREINRIREKVRQPLLQLSEGLKANDKAKDKAIVLYRFAEAVGVPELLDRKTEELLKSGQVQLAEEYRQLWQIFCGVLDQFVEILGESEVDAEEFARLLRLTLEQYSVGTIPATLDQVKVSEMTRNDRHPVRFLFLLGANDHVLPQIENGGGILNDEDRELLASRQISLSNTAVDPLDNELQSIYACLAQASERLYVSYPVTDLNGSELRPSFVVERIRRLFPAVKLSCEDGSDRASIPAAALELAGEEPQGPLWQYFAASHRYDDVLAAMERAGEAGRGRLSPPAVRALYGSTIRMSASRMDRVKNCHFGYFMEYGLRAKERRRAGFEAPEIGTFIHYLLENVTRDAMARGGYGALSREELQELVRLYMDRYAAEEIQEFREKSARFRYLFGRLKTAAMAMIENIADELSRSDFRPRAFELGFGGDGPLPAITIREGDTTLSVSGKVDRVDGWIHDGRLYLRVVDYKTGKKSFDLADVRYGLGIQMLLYLFTLEDAGEAFFGMPVVPSGVLYTPARDDYLRTERGISREKLEKAAQKELRRSGMLLSDPEVLSAMEHEALTEPCYLPISVKKDGSIAGSIATAAQLGKLGGHVDKLLHEIAREMGQGIIDADPCAKGTKLACENCAFLSACCFDAGQDRPRYVRTTTPEEFWKFLDGDGGKEADEDALDE